MVAAVHSRSCSLNWCYNMCSAVLASRVQVVQVRSPNPEEHGGLHLGHNKAFRGNHSIWRFCLYTPFRCLFCISLSLSIYIYTSLGARGKQNTGCSENQSSHSCKNLQKSNSFGTLAKDSQLPNCKNPIMGTRNYHER